MAINNEDQQFCLRWNNFQAYITSQFETLRDDEEFVDVTLACEGQRLGAHKVVLSACSPFFKELFKTNPCSHPIIFMRDVELQHVMALLEFMYAGEVNVAQQNLSGFLKTAESLQIRGLTDASKDQQENEHYPPNTPTPYPPTQCIKKKPEPKLSPTRLVTQDKREAPVSPVPRKRSKTDLEDTDRLTDSETDVKHQKSEDSSINPFALVPSKIHTEIDISQELIEPKLELPDYSEEDTSHDESQNFIDVNDTNNSYATSTGGPDTVPGTSGAVDPSLESQGSPRFTAGLLERSTDKLFEHSAKKVRRSISLEMKMEVIRRMEDGQTRPAICKSMNLPPSTITTIMKNADRIKQYVHQSTTINAKHVSYSRGKLFEKMEELLSLWVDDANHRNIPLTQGIITEKAKMIFEDLKKVEGGKETFLGSKSWYIRFKARSKCLGVKTYDEADVQD